MATCGAPLNGSKVIQGVGRLQVWQALYDLLGVAVEAEKGGSGYPMIRVKRWIRPSAPDYAYG
jgi:hypothetical protein